MKKVFVLLLFLLPGFIYGQTRRMYFDGISFSVPKDQFENILEMKGWTRTEDEGCYQGSYLGNPRDLTLDWYGSNLVSLSIVYTSDREFSILSDFYMILDYFRDYPMWEVTPNMWIIYSGPNEIIVGKTTNETTVKFIDKTNEDKKL